jgi:hypothetical protein
MDPYLETHWLDVHTALIAESRRALNRSLPDGLVARAEERIAIDSDGDAELRASPDVFVYSPSTWPSDQAASGAIVVEAPYKMVVNLDPVKERSVRVENQDGQLITVIEFISPWNKRMPGLKAYQATRAELLNAGVHVVEIDLVRSGNWQALFKPHTCAAKAISLYRVTVRTTEIPPPVYVYPINLKDPLPEIQIPLRATDPKVMLPLQPMIEAIYADGRYGKTLDYTRPLDPPLSADDQQYASSLIGAGG